MDLIARMVAELAGLGCTCTAVVATVTADHPGHLTVAYQHAEGCPALAAHAAARRPMGVG